MKMSAPQLPQRLLCIPLSERVLSTAGAGLTAMPAAARTGSQN